MIRILLVEDDELFRLGLRVRLQQETGFEVVAEAEDGDTAIELANRHPLDIVLMDIGLPGLGGLEACHQFKQKYPALPILVLTSHSQATLIAQLIEAGVEGYCLKGVAAEKLVLAIRSVAAGASWWDRTATQKIRTVFEAGMLEPLPPTKAQPSLALPPASPLTQREQEILELLAAGKTNQEIAQGLYIAPGTVRVHVHAILHKLAVRDRYQAVTVALQKRLINPPS